MGSTFSRMQTIEGLTIIILYNRANLLQFFRKCFRAPYYYLDNPQCSAAALDWNAIPEPDADHNGPISVTLFARHVQELHADGDIGFSKEYEAIQNDAVNEINSSEHSQHPDNKPKNRYLNIIACKSLQFH